MKHSQSIPEGPKLRAAFQIFCFISRYQHLYLASLCPSGASCNVDVHVYAKPPFSLVFVLFWFCSDTCQNETLRQQLQGGSVALFPFGFGIAFAPRGTKEARWASPFPSAFPGGGCGPQSPPAPGCPQACPCRGPGSRSGREAASSQQTQISGPGNREGGLDSLLLGRTWSFMLEVLCIISII